MIDFAAPLPGETVAMFREIKDNENRVGLTPDCVRAIRETGGVIVVEARAGVGAGFTDEEYVYAGAQILEDREEIVRKSDILVKVKEPLPGEYDLLSHFRGKTLFTYLHLSGVDPNLTMHLLKNRMTAIAYETVEDRAGRLPLLTPMSIVAGVLAIQYAAQYLQMKHGGRGLTLSDIPGTDPAHVLVIGGGVVGYTAARLAARMGSRVTLLDISEIALKRLFHETQHDLTATERSRFELLKSTPELLRAILPNIDVLIGAVLVTGKKAPKVVDESGVRLIKPGAVIVDVSIDQGGCIWGSEPTSHTNPTYERDGKIYCSIPNMPGQVPRQSTQALTTATLPYLLKMIEKGVLPALLSDPGFAKGLNTFNGKITCKSVAEDLNMLDRYEEFKSEAPRTAHQLI